MIGQVIAGVLLTHLIEFCAIGVMAFVIALFD